jgi:hypothetical protein
MFSTVATGPFGNGAKSKSRFFIVTDLFAFFNGTLVNIPNVNDKNLVDSTLEVEMKTNLQQVSGTFNESGATLEAIAINERQLPTPENVYLTNGRILAIEAINGVDENSGQTLFYVKGAQNLGSPKTVTYTVNQTLSQIFTTLYS